MNRKKWLYCMVGGILGGIVIYVLNSFAFLFPPLFWALGYIERIPLQIAYNVWVWFFNTFLYWMKEDPNKYFDTAQNIRHLFSRTAIILTGFVPGALLGWLYGKIKNRSAPPPAL